jgi:hypothetical protein
MTAIGPWNRQGLRRQIGEAVMAAQGRLRDHVGATPNEIVPEIIDALLSLAAYASKNNANLTRHMFLAACEVAADEQWPIERG